MLFRLARRDAVPALALAFALSLAWTPLGCGESPAPAPPPAESTPAPVPEPAAKAKKGRKTFDDDMGIAEKREERRKAREAAGTP